MTPDHIDIETLSAFADGDLNAVAALRVERHVAECADCRGDLDRIRGLVARAAALPHDVVPPSEVWAGIKSRLPVPGSRSPVPSKWWHNGYLAAAAGLVLVAGTATMMLLTRPGGAKGAKVVQTSSATTPVVLASVERNYAPTLAVLRETLDAQRSLLAPSTIRTVERSLAVIDSAIAEARLALEADPGSADLLTLLSSSYQRKVEFMKRATSLPASL
jgi:anti-sigma factor RsiW